GEEDSDSQSKKPVAPVAVKIDLGGIERRLIEVPVPAGNYSDLSVNSRSLFWLSRSSEAPPPGPPSQSTDRETLQSVAIGNQEIEVKTVADKIRSYELSDDGKRIVIRKADHLYIVDAQSKPADLAKKEVDLSHWSL